MSYLGLHARMSSWLGAAALFALLAATGCTSTAPRIKVLGVEQTRRAPRQSLVVFVEVVNPTGRNLTLSRLEYRVRAQAWFETKGEVRLEGVDFAYDPPCFTASASQGISIVNQDDVDHTFTMTGTQIDVPVAAGETFNGEAISGVVEPGTYDVVCTLHPQMRGRVTVVA